MLLLFTPLSWPLGRLSIPFPLRPLIHPLPLLTRGRVQNAVKQKISLAKGDSGSGRRRELQEELNEIRNQQSENKLNRGKVFDQLKALQEGIQKKVHHVCHPRQSGFSLACTTD